MCQATVFLDGDKIMEDVIQVRPTDDGVELSTLFEEPRTVKASIRDIDLLKHTVHLNSLEKAEENHEGNGQAAGTSAALDRTQ